MEAVAPEQRTIMSGANELANGLGFAIIGLGEGISSLPLATVPVLAQCLSHCRGDTCLLVVLL